MIKYQYAEMEGCVLEVESASDNLLDETVSSADKDEKTKKPDALASVKSEKPDTKKPVKKKPKGKPPKKKTTKQLAIGLAVKIGAVVLVVWGLFTFVLGITIHYGNNMHPMVRDGDLVITLRPQSPYINAAVMYKHDGKTTVGRVVALEGSVVDIAKNGGITVNGNVPTEEVFYPTYPADGSDIKYPYTVPQGKVFILNDFREDTNDSRSFGAVDAGDLQGTLLLTMRRRGF